MNTSTVHLVEYVCLRNSPYITLSLYHNVVIWLHIAPAKRGNGIYVELFLCIIIISQLYFSLFIVISKFMQCFDQLFVGFDIIIWYKRFGNITIFIWPTKYQCSAYYIGWTLEINLDSWRCIAIIYIACKCVVGHKWSTCFCPYLDIELNSPNTPWFTRDCFITH